MFRFLLLLLSGLGYVHAAAQFLSDDDQIPSAEELSEYEALHQSIYAMMEPLALHASVDTAKLIELQTLVGSLMLNKSMANLRRINREMTRMFLVYFPSTTTTAIPTSTTTSTTLEPNASTEPASTESEGALKA
jgi:hypothetical protein